MPKKKSNSNILKCIVCCLEEGKFPHVLYWQNRSKMIFTVVFVHKNNPNWNESYLALFMELDSLSSKKNYFERPEYVKECKVRCKSNLKKLCDEGTLVKGQKKNFDKSMFSITYQIKDPNGIYRELMTGYRRNPDQEMKMMGEDALKAEKLVEIDFSQSSHYPCLSDQFCSPCKDSGNGSFLDYNEIINSPWKLIILAPTRSETPLRLESSDNSIHGDELNVYGRGCKNLSESGSKQLIMDTDSSIHVSYPDKTSTAVGEFIDISLYASNENCFQESKEYLSNPNTAKGTNGDEEMEILSSEESFHINVTEKENIECMKTETSLLNDDKVEENGFNYYKLDEIQPTIGLLDGSSNPFMGCYEPPTIFP